MEEHRVIQAVDRRTVARICSGQVVIELAVAVKELVENALDAGATQVEVRLREFGVAGFEVTDNGSGIATDNYAGLTAKYHTSKLNTFEDLASVSSFGFRGEAVSSLCELSGQFQVTTRTATSPAAAKLTYARNGTLLKQEPAAHPVGTTVSVTELFAPLPVRRQEFVRCAKKQYGKMLRVLQAYALTASNVRLSCYNVTTKNGAGGNGKKSDGGNGISSSNGGAGSKREQVLSTQGCGDLSGAVANVWGAKFLSALQPVKVDVVVASLSSESNQASEDDAAFNSPIFSSYGNGSSRSSSSSTIDTTEATSTTVAAATTTPPPPATAEAARSTPAQTSPVAAEVKSVHGMVSRVGCGVGRSDNDRQFIFLNNRPVDLPKVVKVVNEVWRCYEMKHKPAFCLHVTWPSHLLDVNLTPDKREVALVGYKDLVACLKQGLHALWAPSRSTFEVNAAAVGGSSSSGDSNGSSRLFASPATPPSADGTAKSPQAEAGAGTETREEVGTHGEEENKASSPAASAIPGRTLPGEAAGDSETTAIKTTETEEGKREENWEGGEDEVEVEEEEGEDSPAPRRSCGSSASNNKRQAAITDAFVPAKKKSARTEKKRCRNRALDDDDDDDDSAGDDDEEKADNRKRQSDNNDDDGAADDDNKDELKEGEHEEEEKVAAVRAGKSKSKRSRCVPEVSSASTSTDSSTSNTTNTPLVAAISSSATSSKTSGKSTTTSKREAPLKEFSVFAMYSSSTTNTAAAASSSSSLSAAATPCWECGDASTGTCGGCCAGFGGKLGVPYCEDCYREVHSSSVLNSGSSGHMWKPRVQGSAAKKRKISYSAGTSSNKGNDEIKDDAVAEVVVINGDDDDDDDNDGNNGDAHQKEEESESERVESLWSPGAMNAPATTAPQESGAGSSVCPPAHAPNEEEKGSNWRAVAGGSPSSSNRSSNSSTSSSSSSSAFDQDNNSSMSASTYPNDKSSNNNYSTGQSAAKEKGDDDCDEEGATNGLNPNQHAKSRDRSLYIDLSATLATAARAAHRKQRKRARLLEPNSADSIGAGAGAGVSAAAALAGATAAGAGAMNEDIGTQATTNSALAARRTRVLTKGDFARLEVLGQFNLGFAVCRLDRDLFILDQHACEEKALFESLQRSTRLHEQQLLRPMPFECSAAEEAVILDHLPVFAFNGFKFQAQSTDDNNHDGHGDQGEGGDGEAPQGPRLKLLTRPHSKGTVFGDDDIHELASLLAENPYEMPPETSLKSSSNSNSNGLLTAGAGPGGCGGSSDYSVFGNVGGSTGPIPRLPKVVSMFASRACRSAVMIGTALDRSALTKIVRRLEGVEQPWNCPHGRPTMRHLADLTDQLTATVAEAD